MSPVKPGDPKGVASKIKKGANYISDKISSNVPIVLLFFLLGLTYYTLFMNKDTAFRDLWYFTLLFGTLSCVIWKLYKQEPLKKSKTIYLFSVIYSIVFLALLYLIYLVEGANKYAEGSFSEKWVMTSGFILFFVIIAIKIFSHERKD